LACACILSPVCWIIKQRVRIRTLWPSGQSSWQKNADVLCFLWGKNSIYICYVEESRPPLWSSGQSSWLRNGYVLWFLWGTNWIDICYVEESRMPLWSSGQSSWLHKGDVLSFLGGTNWIYICYVEESRPPLWSSDQSSWLHNGYVLCFLWGTNWIDICYAEESRPPLWSSGYSSWLQIQRSWLDSRRYQFFWDVVGLERIPLSLVSTIEELLGRKSSGCGLGGQEYGRRNPSRSSRDTPLSSKFGNNFCRQAAVVRSVYFARGLRPWSPQMNSNWPLETSQLSEGNWLIIQFYGLNPF
jgi:hypothetical protein